MVLVAVLESTLTDGGLLLTLRVGVLFGQGIGAVAVIRVTGFDQLGNIKPGHFAGFNFDLALSG